MGVFLSVSVLSGLAEKRRRKKRRGQGNWGETLFKRTAMGKRLENEAKTQRREDEQCKKTIFNAFCVTGYAQNHVKDDPHFFPRSYLLNDPRLFPVFFNDHYYFFDFPKTP